MDLFKNCIERQVGNGLQWLNEPEEWYFNNEGLYIRPDGKTDVFRKYNQTAKDSACFLFTEVEGDFTLLSKIWVESTAFADAGAITIRGDEKLWAKLCIEQSPVGELSIVSVVTNEWSDDANNELLQTSEAFLRITRKGNLIGMHYSVTGKTWRFVRTFALDWPLILQVGVQAQAPVREGCKVYVEELHVSKEVISDFRSGE